MAFGVVCGLAPLAQAIRIRVKRSSEEVSLLWLALYACGAGVWLGYGAVEGSAPLLVSQAVALTSVTVTLSLAVRARRRVRRRYVPRVENTKTSPEKPTVSRAALTNARRARKRLERSNGPPVPH